jgi:hypothetical protein
MANICGPKVIYFCPDLIKDDKRFGEPIIFISEFYTSFTSGDYGVVN